MVAAAVASRLTARTAPGTLAWSPVSRQTIAKTTAPTQPRLMITAHGERTSLPVPSVCSIASGQHAYATQWTARHTAKPMRWRSRLVMTSATSSSMESTPRPSHTGRYDPVNGATVLSTAMPANGSTIEVTMWMARNTSTSSERLRCTAWVRKRGQSRLSQRIAVTMPSPRMAVSISRLTYPVLRAAYQSAVGPEAAITPPAPP